MKKLILISLLSIGLLSCEAEPAPTGVPAVTPTNAVQGVVPSWIIGQWYNEQTERILDIADYAIFTDLSGLSVPFADAYIYEDISTLVVHDEHIKWLQTGNHGNMIMRVTKVNTHTEIQKVQLEVSYQGTWHNMGYYTKL